MTLKKWFVRIKGGAIHPLILPIFPILSLYLSNMGQGFLSQAAPILGGVFALSLIGWALTFTLMKDRNKSALIVSAFFVLFFSFGHSLTALSVVLERLNLLDTLWFILYARHARLFWTVIWIALVIGFTIFVAKGKRNVKKLTEFLNFMAVTLVVIAAGNFILADGFRLYLRPVIERFTSQIHSQAPVAQADYQMKHQVFMPFISKPEPQAAGLAQHFEEIWLSDLPPVENPSHELPDIYYIIPDMYIRADYLTELYQCDTSDFSSFLEDQGFYIARESRSNYHLTTHSLASSLNYMYLNDLAKQIGYIIRFSLSAQMIQQNRLTAFLESQGYTTIAFATGFWFTEFKDADIYMEPPASKWIPSEFEAGVIKLTPLSAFSIFDQSRDEAYRRRALYTLNHIPDGTKIDGPAFVFAHILSPHDPFVFDAYGAPIPSQDGYTYEEYKKAYCNQVLHINRRLQEVVDEILSHSPKPPIIIIQGDHGAIYGVDYGDYINERMSILNAYYFPDQNYADLYPGITPVNTFRIVLNNYFGADYALLDDISYYTPPGAYYDFVDVTDEVIGE